MPAGGLLSITLPYKIHTAGMYTVVLLQVAIKTDVTYGSRHWIYGNSSTEKSGSHRYVYVLDLDQYMCTDINCTYGNKT